MISLFSFLLSIICSHFRQRVSITSFSVALIYQQILQFTFPLKSIYLAENQSRSSCDLAAFVSQQIFAKFIGLVYCGTMPPMHFIYPLGCRALGLDTLSKVRTFTCQFEKLNFHGNFFQQ